MIELILGQVLRFGADAMIEGPGAARVEARGAVALRAGRILDVGAAADLRARYPAAQMTDMGQKLLSAGFIDTHVHYPQTAIIASWGKRLIDWLNTYTFPEEMRFADPAHAAAVAKTYFDLALAHGTTSMCSYCTIHPASVEAFFLEAEARGMRALAGRTCMDRATAPAGLRDTAQAAYDESKALLQRWHGRGRLGYVLTPRFSPTSTPDQLLALGSLWAEHPECLMQTHLSEQVDEIAWVKSLYPQARDYLDTYETFGLLGANAVYGHAIHLEPREMARLVEVGAGLAHCPTSNTFIGSGLFDTAGMAAAGLRVGLATDTGGGSSFSMLRTMAAAYEVAQLRGVALHPAQLWYLATAGAARLLRLEDKVGNLAPGMEADLIALDLASTPAIAQRAARAETFWEALFPTIMMGDDRAIAGVWVGGKRQR
ncbi:guanine deaminase [Rhodobacter lacus]|uniref:Guanine deaminase n=1 Tax=Rhodobacter lacus TaxID=1641972 RepID=A0ABW5AA71_9RHOB